MAWIVSDPDHLGGKPRVRETRIAVALLLEWLAAGMTIDEIAEFQGISARSAKLNWAYARAWLGRELDDPAGGN